MIKIRLFDNMLRFFSGDKAFQALLPNFITKHVMVVIASDGTLSEHDDFKVINFAQRGGSIRDTTLYEFANSPLRRYLDLVTQTIPGGCQSCEWRGYCRAGVTHGLTVSRYSRANGFDNTSSLCRAFSSLFEAGAGYLMKNGLPAYRLRDALEAQGLGSAVATPSLRSVPQELFS
jgi:radical SAM protein with 4Fe4S-binding SPASM domain